MAGTLGLDKARVMHHDTAWFADPAQDEQAAHDFQDVLTRHIDPRTQLITD